MTIHKPTVFVVDDDVVVREALGSLIRSVGLGVLLFGSAQEFLGAPKPDTVACLVLDVRMPGLSGFDCQRKLAEAGFPIPIVFMTGHGDIPMSVRAMKAGAVDFLTKPVDGELLLSAVANALALDQARRAADMQRRVLRERYQKLTAREREVFARVTEGRLNKQIAAELGTSERTIKAHRAQVMDKMGVRCVTELARAADQLTGATIGI